MSLVWLYAVTTAGVTPAAATGLEGEPLRLLTCGRLALIAGELESLPAVTPATLRAHDRVVRQLAAGVAELLPARFGQSAADGEELERRLLGREQELGRALERVSGCIQMTLRLFGEPAPPQPADGADATSAGGPGTRYLLGRQRLEAQRHALPEAAELLAVLRPLVRAQRLERQLHGVLLGTAYHLVPRPQVPEYSSEVAAHRARLLPRRVTIAGPAPPYAFAAEETTLVESS